MSREKICGSKKVFRKDIDLGVEFYYKGYQFKSVGSFLMGMGLGEGFYKIYRLPRIEKGAFFSDRVVLGTKNDLIVQEKATGGFFWMDCGLEVERVEL